MFALGPIMLFFLFIPILGWIIDILLGIAVFLLVRPQGICKRLTIIKESIS